MKRKATREERIGEEEVARGEVDAEMKVVVLSVEVVVEEVLQAEEEVTVVLLVEEEGVEVVHQEGAEVEEGETKAGTGWCRRTNLSPIFLQKKYRGGYMMVSN